MSELIFVSSTQKELATERRAIAELVRRDALLSRFFTVFLFEELSPRDQRADELYLKKVDQASVYVGIIGSEYGSEDAAGVSPVEHEFDRATARGITRLIFLKGEDDGARAVFKGNVAQQVDRGADFVLATLSRSVGTREYGSAAPVAYEIPPDVVREAIVNAVAHRNYGSAAAVQVSVFADRVEVWNPGELPPSLTPARLHHPHESVARNPRVCEALFLTRYIEKYGTGTLMMIRECAESGLSEPEFEQRGGEFVVTVWRDWLTEQVLDRLALNDRQRRAVALLKVNRRITNKEYQQVTGVTDRTTLRDLRDLVSLGVIERIGGTGRGTYYIIARRTSQESDKPDIGGRHRQTRQKPDKPDTIADGDGLKRASRLKEPAKSPKGSAAKGTGKRLRARKRRQ